MEEELTDSLHAQQSSTQPLLDSFELSRQSLLNYPEGSQGCSGVALVDCQGSDVGLLATALARRMVQNDRQVSQLAYPLSLCIHSTNNFWCHAYTLSPCLLLNIMLAKFYTLQTSTSFKHRHPHPFNTNPPFKHPHPQQDTSACMHSSFARPSKRQKLTSGNCLSSEMAGK